MCPRQALRSLGVFSVIKSRVCHRVRVVMHPNLQGNARRGSTCWCWCTPPKECWFGNCCGLRGFIKASKLDSASDAEWATENLLLAVCWRKKSSEKQQELQSDFSCHHCGMSLCGHAQWEHRDSAPSRSAVLQYNAKLLCSGRTVGVHGADQCGVSPVCGGHPPQRPRRAPAHRTARIDDARSELFFNSLTYDEPSRWGPDPQSVIE